MSMLAEGDDLVRPVSYEFLEVGLAGDDEKELPMSRFYATIPHKTSCSMDAIPDAD